MAERVEAQTPRCPNGCIAGVRSVLSEDPTVNRWQCSNIDCLRNFSSQKPGYGRPPLLGLEAKKEATVADLTCEKCPGLTFKTGRSLGAHRWQKHPGDPKPSPTPAERKTKTAARKPARAKAPAKKKVGVIDSALDLLYIRRDELIQKHPALDGVMNAIRALEDIA